MNNRRNILKGIALSPLAITGSTVWANPNTNTENITADIPEKMTILFQGDAVTSAGRDHAAYYPNQTMGMGMGYVQQIASELLGRHPKADFRIYNRAMPNQTASTLLGRWRDDCLILRPTVLSLLVGTDDVLQTEQKVSTESYARDLKFLVKRTLSTNKDVKVIVGEPFALKGGGRSIDQSKLTAFQAASKKVAEELETAYLPYQSIFDAAIEDAPAEHWTFDGITPTLAGSYLMRQEWLKVFYRLFV